MPDPSTATASYHKHVNGTDQTITVYGPYEVLTYDDLSDEELEREGFTPEEVTEEEAMSHSWFRVPNHPDDIAKGEAETTLYDLGDFSADWGITRGSGHPYQGWDGYMADSAFSACLVRYCDEEGNYLGWVADHVMFGRVSW